MEAGAVNLAAGWLEDYSLGLTVSGYWVRCSGRSTDEGLGAQVRRGVKVGHDPEDVFQDEVSVSDLG